MRRVRSGFTHAGISSLVLEVDLDGGVVVDCTGGNKGTKDGIVKRLEKSGGGVVDREAMKGLVKRAVDRWAEVEKATGGKR